MQSRSRQTVDWILEATTRIFRAEGFDATTNRIAAAAGVSIGTLYEYFPNKEALLYALAERHVALAETGVDAVLTAPTPSPEWLAAIQAAVAASHRYPSQALALLADARGRDLRERVSQLRARTLAGLVERARAERLTDPELRARTVFGLIAELTSQVLHEPEPAGGRQAMLQHVLALATEHFRAAGR